MPSFQGERSFALPVADVWAKLSDARFLVRCIPDVQTIVQVEAGGFTCIVRPGFAFVRGTVELSLQVAEAIPGTSVRVQVHSKGIGSSSDVEAELYCNAVEGGTQVQWRAVIVNLGGLLKAVPQGLIQAAAQKVIADVWQSIEKQVTGGG
jgi:carbon monoxide dehydrogenase subunit G